MTDEEDLRNKADRIAEQIHDAVVAAHEDKICVILVGNPDSPRTRFYEQAYRNAGYKVTIEDTRSTCAIGGMPFHTVVVDELHVFDKLDVRGRFETYHFDPTVVTGPQILKPKNQPHGPQRKGRGGKTRKW